jgi:hypothetical protein
VDKRRPHLATLVAGGDITREYALEQLRKDPYADADFESDLEFCIKKLQFTRDSFEQYMCELPKSHREYTNNAWVFEGMSGFRNWVKGRMMRI